MQVGALGSVSYEGSAHRHREQLCNGMATIRLEQLDENEEEMPRKINIWNLLTRNTALKDTRRTPARDDEAYRAGRKVYDSTRWQRLRRMQLAEFPLCRVCACAGAHIDHIKTIRAGGEPYDQANLQTLCASCHSSKTATEMRISTIN